MTTDIASFEITELDWDYAPPCDIERCDNAAQLVCEVRCCKAKILICRKCLAEVIDGLARRSGHYGECNFCDQTILLSIEHIIVVRTLDNAGSTG